MKKREKKKRENFIKNRLINDRNSQYISLMFNQIRILSLMRSRSNENVDIFVSQKKEFSFYCLSKKQLPIYIVSYYIKCVTTSWTYSNRTIFTGYRRIDRFTRGLRKERSTGYIKKFYTSSQSLRQYNLFSTLYILIGPIPNYKARGKEKLSHQAL